MRMIWCGKWNKRPTTTTATAADWIFVVLVLAFALLLQSFVYELLSVNSGNKNVDCVFLAHLREIYTTPIHTNWRRRKLDLLLPNSFACSFSIFHSSSSSLFFYLTHFFSISFHFNLFMYVARCSHSHLLNSYSTHSWLLMLISFLYFPRLSNFRPKRKKRTEREKSTPHFERFADYNLQKLILLTLVECENPLNYGHIWNFSLHISCLFIVRSFVVTKTFLVSLQNFVLDVCVWRNFVQWVLITWPYCLIIQCYPCECHQF